MFKASLFRVILAVVLISQAVLPQTGYCEALIPNAAALSLQGAFISIADHYKTRVVSITTEQVIRQAVPQYEFFYGDPFDHFFDDFFNDNRQPRSKKKRRKPKQRFYEKKLEGGGTGVVIDEKGYVLTNYHVINNADNIKVRFGMDETETYDAEVVGKDQYTDLAVLKIKSDKAFKAAQMGDSDILKTGSWVVAIGSPFGLEQTVTTGIVSAMRQAMNIEGKRYENFIQTDAAINRGNSGGPLVNIQGEVIGINTAIYAPTGVFSGIGFAIPINQAKSILDDLIHKGKVVRGWLGVEIRAVDDAISKQFGLEKKYGALVNKVVPGSPAAKGGLKRGDVIISINGEEVKDVVHLQKVVKSADPGEKIRIMVMRDEVKRALNVKLGTMPDDTASLPASDEENYESEWKGITVSNLTNELIEQYSIPGGEIGVIVTKIDYDKAEVGLHPGDLIKEINRRKVADIADFKKVIKKIKLSDGVVFDIIRNGKSIYMSYHKD